MGYPPPPVVVLCESCGACYSPRLRGERVFNCTECQAPAHYAVEDYSRLKFPDGKWMLLESVACNLILSSVAEFSDKHVDVFLSLSRLLGGDPRSFKDSLPLVVLRDTSTDKADHLNEKLIAAGFTTKIHYHCYSWQCAVRITAVASLNAPLIKQLSALTGKNAMEARKFLMALPAIVFSEIDLHQAKEVSEELRKLGATASIVHDVELPWSG